MATASGGAPAPVKPASAPGSPTPAGAGPARAQASAFSVEHHLFREEGICFFDFFQAIRMLRLLAGKDRVAVGLDGPPQRELVRFLAHVSLSFPASSMYKLVRDTGTLPPKMTVNFLGLTGPSGVLPRPYTERLMVETRGPERAALQDWLDLFNHRFTSLFYRAWEKYHFYLPYERGEAFQRDPDTFSRCLFSFVGIGFRSHRNRLRVASAEARPNVIGGEREMAGRDKELARLDDLPFLRFGGFFAHRPRCALSLEIFLRVYLQLDVKVHQFEGQWLHLNAESQTSAGVRNSRLGQEVLVGDRIWDVQSKVRICLGPLNYLQFLDLLPDQTPVKRRKRIFLLAQLIRIYVGAEIDIEFQLLLKKADIPATQTGPHIRLGWNSWSRTQPYTNHAKDTIFTVSDRGLIDSA